MTACNGNKRTVGLLRVKVVDTAADLGRAAARHTAELIRRRAGERGGVRLIVATGNSQLPFIRALREETDVPWNAVTVFHMDEYIGIGVEHSASFQRWIKENVADHLSPAQVHYIDGNVEDVEAECGRYEALLREAPLDLVCMGIGENGHIAFNEPYRADFNDTQWVRTIELDDQSRKQQVGEGHFPTVDDVPRYAISLTVPALLAPAAVQVCAPEKRKAAAVRSALYDPISVACPATIVREHPNSVLFLDRGSSSLLDAEATEA